MKRTISFNGEVLYIVERRSSFDNNGLYFPNVSIFERNMMDNQTNERQWKQWINPDKNELFCNHLKIDSSLNES